MIELVVGSMFSGKSEYLLSQASKYKAIGYNVLPFKSTIDTRSSGVLHSRVGSSVSATEVSTWREIEDTVFKHQGQPTLALIDEVHFMPPHEIVDQKYLDAGYFLWNLRERCRYELKIILAGLLFTTERVPFPTPQSILTVSDKITHLRALCTVCGNPAAFTICTKAKERSTKPLVGDSELYAPRCGKCYSVGNPNWER